jgi:type I restriction enzyme S subunit
VLRRIKVNELGRVVTGRTPPTAHVEYFGNEYLFIKPSDISPGKRRVFSTETRLSASGARYLGSNLLPKDTTCVVCIGTLGKFALTSEPCFTNQQLNSVVVDTKTYDPLYVFYRLSTILPRLKKLQGGSASGREHVNKTNFGNIELDIHTLPVQRRISSILSAYDDLIENNTRRIKILEQMAQMLYREWFVNFRFPGHEKVKMVDSEMGLIPEGWRVGPLGDIAVYIGRGISPTYDDAAKGLVINQRCIRNRKLNLAPARRQSKKVPQERMVREGDVLVNSTGVGTLGRVAQVLESIANCTVDSHVSIVRPKENVEFFGKALLELEGHFAAQGVGATGQTELSRERIASTQIVVPPGNLQANFCRAVAPMNKMLVCCLKRSDTLQQTRDLLLPTLVSGGVSVEQLETEAVAQMV